MDVLSEIWERLQNPILYAIPFFFVCIAIEAAFYAWDARQDAPTADPAEKGYRPIDTWTSMTMGGGAIVAMAVFKSLTLVLFTAMSVYLAPWHIPDDTWWSWVLLFVAVDLTWYCNHRFSHRVRIGWAAHQAHHSSEFFNFGTALRQKWNPWSEAIFWLPLPLLGFEPWTIYVAMGFNLIYQFFSHTERVGRLWAPIELVMNTPSHHRVHHGSDDIYLDKNFGGILIIWDRMFGTFQPEVFTPNYGLTTQVSTYNPFKLEYHEYAAIVRDVRAAKGLRAKLGHVFGPPGWNPVDGSPKLPPRDDPARSSRTTVSV